MLSSRSAAHWSLQLWFILYYYTHSWYHFINSATVALKCDIVGKKGCCFVRNCLFLEVLNVANTQSKTNSLFSNEFSKCDIPAYLFTSHKSNLTVFNLKPHLGIPMQLPNKFSSHQESYLELWSTNVIIDNKLPCTCWFIVKVCCHCIFISHDERQIVQ